MEVHDEDEEEDAHSPADGHGAAAAPSRTSQEQQGAEELDNTDTSIGRLLRRRREDGSALVISSSSPVASAQGGAAMGPDSPCGLTTSFDALRVRGTAGAQHTPPPQHAALYQTADSATLLASPPLPLPLVPAVPAPAGPNLSPLPHQEPASSGGSGSSRSRPMRRGRALVSNVVSSIARRLHFK